MDNTDKIKNLHGFVFDFDGTLVDSRINFPLMKQKIVELLKKWNIYSEGIENGHYVLELVEHGCRTLSDFPLLEAAFKREAFGIIEKIEQLSCSKAVPFPGTTEALEKLHSQGYRIGIITRNGRSAIDAVLSRFSFTYESIFTREDVSRIKPDPEHLLKAVEALNTKPSYVAMVGDHPIDIRCGKAAGTVTIGVLTSVSTKEDLENAGADLVVPAVSHIVDLLKSIA